MYTKTHRKRLEYYDGIHPVPMCHHAPSSCTLQFNCNLCRNYNLTGELFQDKICKGTSCPVTAYLLLKNSIYIPLVVTVCMWMGGSRTDDDLLRINILAGSGHAGIKRGHSDNDPVRRPLILNFFFSRKCIFKLRI